MTTVVPPPEDLPSWADDTEAVTEEHSWDKEGILKGQEERNHLWWLKAYGFVVVSFLIVFSLLFLGSLGSWSWHYLAPSWLHWLDSAQLSKIQSILFSGSIGGVVSLIAQKQLSK